MAVCVVKVGKIILFCKHWKKSDQSDHSYNMWKDASSYKLQKEHSKDGFNPKVWSFLLRNRTLIPQAIAPFLKRIKSLQITFY